MSDNVYRVGIEGDASGLKAAGQHGKDALKSVDDAAKAANASIGDGTKGAAVDAGKALTEAGSTGRKSMADIGAGAQLAIQGLRAAVGLAHDFGAAIQEAYERQKKMANQFIGERDKIRELANVMGVRADNKFTLENQTFNRDTAMKPEEGLAFRTQFQNSGAQFKGSKISETEFAQYEKQSAQLIAARGLDPDNSGDFAGSVLGFKDRKGMGDKASEHALGKVSSGLAILGRGKGRNSVLINQMSMLGSSALNEDEMKGVFQDSDEVATVISVAAEKHDAQAAEMAKAAIRAIRDNDAKVVALRQKAGINAKTPFIESMKRIAPIVEQQAKEQGIKIEDALAQTFPGILERDAIGVFINKGVGAGLFEDRTAFAKTVQGPQPALDEIQKFQNSPEEGGGDRTAAGSLKLNELQRAEKDAIIQRLRTQAQAELETEGKGSTQDSLWKTAARKLSLGFVNPDEAQENHKIEEILSRRGAVVGVDTNQIAKWAPFSAEGQNQIFRERIEAVQAAGGKPYDDSQGGAIGAGSTGVAEVVAALDRIERKLPDNAQGYGQGTEARVSEPLNSPQAWNSRP